MKIVFFGDSITDCGRDRADDASLGNGYVAILYEKLKNLYEDVKFEFLIRGIGGTRVCDRAARVDRDVVAEKPDIAVVLVGINDVWRKYDGGADFDLDAFSAAYEEVLKKIKDCGAKLIVVEPFLFDVPDKKLYAIKWIGDFCEPYGITHPIAEKLISRALNRDLPYRGILFDYDNTPGKITALEQLPKKSGKLMLSKVTIGDDSVPEDHLVISCVDDLGNTIEQDTARRLFNLNARAYDINEPFNPGKLEEIFESQKAEILRQNAEIAEKEFDAEVEKLES